MTIETKEKRVKLSAHDKEAAMRLYAEAHKAIEGLAKIGAKAPGITLGDDDQLMFTPRSHKPRAVENKEVMEFEGIEITCGHPETVCVLTTTTMSGFYANE